MTSDVRAAQKSTLQTRRVLPSSAYLVPHHALSGWAPGGKQRQYVSAMHAMHSIFGYKDTLHAFFTFLYVLLCKHQGDGICFLWAGAMGGSLPLAWIGGCGSVTTLLFLRRFMRPVASPNQYRSAKQSTTSALPSRCATCVLEFPSVKHLASNVSNWQLCVR